jgi:exosortase A-associated hydrolase 1
LNASAVTERALTFECQEETLVGILHEPAMAAAVGVVVVVGGPQYRVGSHRHFVLLARAVAAAGFAVLRFDYRGMGDSSGGARGFEAVNMDVAAAISALQTQVPKVTRVALWGLCDGASAALLYLDANHDARVNGLCVLNPWVRSDATLARTHLKHYYPQRLLDRAFWIKVLSGRVGVRAGRTLIANLRGQRAKRGKASMSFQQRMARAWTSFDGMLLLILSGDDYTAKEFVDALRDDEAWASAMRHRGLERHDLLEADHTFSDHTPRQLVNELTVEWLRALTAESPSRIKEEPA